MSLARGLLAFGLLASSVYIINDLFIFVWLSDSIDVTFFGI